MLSHEDLREVDTSSASCFLVFLRGRKLVWYNLRGGGGGGGGGRDGVERLKDSRDPCPPCMSFLGYRPTMAQKIRTKQTAGG